MNFREALYVLFRWLGTLTRSSASPCAQVTALLEKHTTKNPDGNVAIVAVDEDGGDDGGGEGTGVTIIRRRRLRNMCWSKLWHANKLHRLAMYHRRRHWARRLPVEIMMTVGRGRLSEVTTCAMMMMMMMMTSRVETLQNLLLGKFMTLCNNLDNNEYHISRIVDWQTCTVYPRRHQNPPPEPARLQHQ
jgi:hypothetical protein